jgi:hypothetical protein
VEPAGDLPVIATPAPLAQAAAPRDADFQAAWYYSILISAGIALAVWAFALCVRYLRRMWRRGDRGLAVGLAAAVAVVFVMFASMLVTVAVAMWPSSRPGAG